LFVCVFGTMDLLNFNTLHPWEAYTCVLVKALDYSSSSRNRRNNQKNYGWSLLPLPVSWNCWRKQCFWVHFGTNRTVLFGLIPHRSYCNTWNIYLTWINYIYIYIYMFCEWKKERKKDEYSSTYECWKRWWHLLQRKSLSVKPTSPHMQHTTWWSTIFQDRKTQKQNNIT